jgi:hypothetical protein
MQLGLKAREEQAVDVSNQNLNNQDFKFDVSVLFSVDRYTQSAIF